MISIEQLEQLFDGVRADTDSDPEGDMLWGYFFFNRDPKKLEGAAKRLTDAGYRVVGLNECDDGSTYVLHVEKVEQHTPQTLHARNTEFHELASELDLDSYDGMDVGPVDPRDK